MTKEQQEIHLLPVGLTTGAPMPADVASPSPAALALCFAPQVLAEDSTRSPLPVPNGSLCERGVVVEPIITPHKQLRLLAAFPKNVFPTVNGEPAPRWIVLAPGDWLQWVPGLAYRVALFSRPQMGSPTGSAVGKRCPVCSVPFTPDTRCVACPCGVVLHCEADGPDALQCAQLRRACPACQRPVVLAAGYVNPPNDEG